MTLDRTIHRCYGRIVTQQQPKRSSAQRMWLAASSLVGCVAAGIVLGLWLDRSFGTAPLWLAVCGLGSVAAAMYGLIREAGR